MAGEHHLAVDVSDARAVFRIEGDRAADVLRKLSPVDFDTLDPGELRRTRAAQVAAALWQQDGGYTLVCFRSVAGYVMGLLTHSAQPGSELSEPLKLDVCPVGDCDLPPDGVDCGSRRS